MKKGLIVTTALAMVLGVGAAVGAHQAKVQQVKAGNDYGTSWYVTGTVNGGNWGVWQPISTHNESENRYELEVSVTTDSEFKIFNQSSYDGHQINRASSNLDYNGKGWLEYTDWAEGDNFKMKEAGSFIIYFVDNIATYDNVDWGFGIEKIGVTPEPTHTYAYKVNNGTVVEMDDGDNNQVISGERKFDKYDSVEFLKDGVALEVTPKDDDQATKVYAHSSTKLIFAEDYTGVLYLNTVTNKLWAGQFTPGYYLAGVDGNWQAKLGIPASLEGGDNPQAYVASNVTLTANSEVQFVEVPNSGAISWKATIEGQIHAGEGITATKEGNNLKIAEADTYDIYYNPTSGWYSVEKYVEPAPDPVYTVSCRYNDPVEFTLDEENKPAGVVHQYSAQVQYACRAGILQFYKDGVEMTSGIGVDWDTEHDKPVAGNNIYGNVTDGFRLAHTVNYTGKTKLYLKTYPDGGVSLWGEGYQDNTFYSYIKDGTGKTTTVYMYLDEEYEPNETYVRQYKTSDPVVLKALSGVDGQTSFSLDSAGLSEDVTPEAVAGNNAMQAYQASMWKVHNDCEQNIYIKERASDLELFIYVGGYEESHVLRIGGNDVALHKVNENEYAATGVTLNSGDMAATYTIEGEEQEFTAKVVGNNNLAEDKSIIASGTCDIYFNVTNNTLFVSGLPLGGYHMLKNGTLVEMASAGYYEGFEQYKTEKISFHTGDEIQFVNCNGEAGVKAAEVFTVSAFNAGGMGDKFTYNGATEMVECLEDCTVAVYLKLKYQQDEIYFGEVAEHVLEAINFANAFKSAMATACSAEGKKAAVEAAWAAQATAYAGLSEQAQGELYLGSYSTVDEIIEFGERYMAIKQQHPDWTLDNFLDWEIPPSTAFVPTSEQSSVSKNANILIIIVASVSVISLATLIVIKKRKHN